MVRRDNAPNFFEQNIFVVVVVVVVVVFLRVSFCVCVALVEQLGDDSL